MISPRKLEANRRNALKSTGPRTEAGKRISSKNALMHGLCATGALTSDEASQPFEELCASLQRELNPQGPAEQNLFEQIAILAWKARRVRAIEQGLIALQFEYRSVVEGGAAIRRRARDAREAATTLAKLARYQNELSVRLRKELRHFRQMQKSRVARAQTHSGPEGCVEQKIPKRTHFPAQVLARPDCVVK
jgi:hypothetical protein